MGIVGTLVMLVLMVSPLAPPLIGAVVGAIYDRSKAAKRAASTSLGVRGRQAVVASS